LEARIVGVAVWGPGLEGWIASRPVLAGEADYMPADSPAPPPAILSANERRRTGPVARLALTVASEAAAMSGLPPSALRAVFASGNGDGVVVGSILEDLTIGGTQGRLVSPTQFHNSVHNAACGYWSIAVGGHLPTTCLAGHDFSWPAALMVALAELAEHNEPVLLCVYDHPLPPPLHAKRPLIAPFGVGLVLAAPGTDGGLGGIAVRYIAEPSAAPSVRCRTEPSLTTLRALAAGNPAAQSLPLLKALARGEAATHAVPYLDGRLDVIVTQ
jgi:hypothetical protein